MRLSPKLASSLWSEKTENKTTKRGGETPLLEVSIAPLMYSESLRREREEGASLLQQPQRCWGRAQGVTRAFCPLLLSRVSGVAQRDLARPGPRFATTVPPAPSSLCPRERVPRCHVVARGKEEERKWDLTSLFEGACVMSVCR